MTEKKLYLWTPMVNWEEHREGSGDTEYLMLGVLAESLEEARSKALKKVDALIEIDNSDFYYYGRKKLNVLRETIAKDILPVSVDNVEMFLYHEHNSQGDDSFGNIKWFHKASEDD